jgi:hypothetical protein
MHCAGGDQYLLRELRAVKHPGDLELHLSARTEDVHQAD